MWYPSVSLVTAFLALYTGTAVGSFCGESPVQWRNYNMTCPERAVCADVFTFVRDWYNGTSCENKRIHHHCICPDGTVCPYDNPDYRIFASRVQERYTCRPKCTLPFCGNISQRPTRGRATPPVAMTFKQNALDFGDRSYYRMDCRCPLHHRPYTQGPGRSRAETHYATRYDYRTHSYDILYVCNSIGNFNDDQSDPCEN